MPSWNFWLWPVLLAPFVGSFLGVVALRASEPRAIVTGRSQCPSCQTRLRPLHLVPLVSWLLLHGRCRYCGARIGLYYPGMELAALFIAAWAASLTEGALLWASCGLGWTLLALAAADFRHFLLPDFLTLPLVLAGLATAAFFAPDNLHLHALGAIGGWSLVIAIRFAYRKIRHREGMGLGDAKLLAASGAWVSLEGIPSVLLIGAVSGLLFALIGARRKGGLALTDRVPFGAFLALGTWIVWLYGPVAAG